MSALVFELRWAYWLRDTIPGVTEVVELEGAKLFFPDERGAELASHLRRHWSALQPTHGRWPRAATSRASAAV
jgi:hypothetical protein